MKAELAARLVKFFDEPSLLTKLRADDASVAATAPDTAEMPIATGLQRVQSQIALSERKFEQHQDRKKPTNILDYSEKSVTSVILYQPRFQPVTRDVAADENCILLSAQSDAEVKTSSWLDANPSPSSFSSCAQCENEDRPDDQLGPHGIESKGHSGLYGADWMATRQAQALVALGVIAPEPVQIPIPVEDIIFDRMVSLFQEAPIPLSRKCDEQAMAECYREYAERNEASLHQDFIDWGLVPQNFEQVWVNARALWFTEVHDAAKRIQSN